MKGSRTRGPRRPELDLWMRELAAAEARPVERGSRRLLWALVVFLGVAVGLYVVRLALERGLEQRRGAAPAGAPPEPGR